MSLISGISRVVFSCFSTKRPGSKMKQLQEMRNSFKKIDEGRTKGPEKFYNKKKLLEQFVRDAIKDGHDKDKIRRSFNDCLTAMQTEVSKKSGKPARMGTSKLQQLVDTLLNQTSTPSQHLDIPKYQTDIAKYPPIGPLKLWDENRVKIFFENYNIFLKNEGIDQLSDTFKESLVKYMTSDNIESMFEKGTIENPKKGTKENPEKGEIWEIMSFVENSMLDLGIIKSFWITINGKQERFSNNNIDNYKKYRTKVISEFFEIAEINLIDRLSALKNEDS